MQDIFNEQEIEKKKSDFSKKDKYVKSNDSYFNKENEGRKEKSKDNFSSFRELKNEQENSFRKTTVDIDYGNSEELKKKNYSKKLVKKAKEIEDIQYFNAQEYEKQAEENHRKEEINKQSESQRLEEQRKTETTQKTYYEHQQEDRRKKEYQIQKDEEIRLEEQSQKPVASTIFRSATQKALEKFEEANDGMRSMEKSFNEIQKEDGSGIDFDERVVDLRDRKEKFQSKNAVGVVGASLISSSKDFRQKKAIGNDFRSVKKDIRKERYKKRKAKELREAQEFKDKQQKVEQQKHGETERNHKLLTDQDLDKDGVIDRYYANPRDSSIQHHYQLDTDNKNFGKLDRNVSNEHEDYSFRDNKDFRQEKYVGNDFRSSKKDIRKERYQKQKTKEIRKNQELEEEKLRTEQQISGEAEKKQKLLIDKDHDYDGVIDRYDTVPSSSYVQEHFQSNDNNSDDSGKHNNKAFKEFRSKFNRKAERRERKEYDNKYYYDREDGVNTKETVKPPNTMVEGALLSIGYTLKKQNTDQNIGVKATAKTIKGVSHISKAGKKLYYNARSGENINFKKTDVNLVDVGVDKAIDTIDSANRDENIGVNSIVKPYQAVKEFSKVQGRVKGVAGTFRNFKEKFNFNKFYQKRRNKNFASEIRNKGLSKTLSDIKKKVASRIRNILSMKTIKSVFSLKYIIPVLILILFVMGFMQACSSVFLTTSSVLSGTSYLASPIDVTKSEEYYSEKEAKLEHELNNIQSIYSGYDEYRVTKDTIDHDPHLITAYLTIRIEDFKYHQIKDELDNIFNQQYKYTVSKIEETRYRTVYNDLGEPIEIPYKWRILEATLFTNDLEEGLKALLTPEERERFDLLIETKGNFMNLNAPTEEDWKQNIEKKFGYSINKESGEIQYYDGIDINGSGELHALTSGKVVEVSGNKVVIEDLGIDNGKWYVSYENVSGIAVKNYQQVNIGDKIATANGTYTVKIRDSKGHYINPYFHLYSDSRYITEGNPENISNESFEQFWNEQLEKLTPEELADLSKKGAGILKEAYKYIGTPYVYGAKNPAKDGGIDCSGFVRLAYKGAGMNIPDGSINQWNKSTKISESSLQPGDLIFFNKTFKGRGNQVTHVGIYVGDGKMIHAGSPVNVTNYRNNFFKDKIVGFGRYN